MQGDDIDPLRLGRDACLHILRSLDAQSVLALSSCSRDWRALTADEGLWRHLACRDQPTLAAQHAASRTQGLSWAQTYARAHTLQSLRHVAWNEDRPAGRRPRDREGHAACSWGRHSMLLHGGFGGGIISDLHILTPSKPQRAGSSSASGRSGRGGGHANASVNAGSSYRWVQPRVAGRSPVFRYGHTISRCGEQGEVAVLFGGMMAGGYEAPLDTVAVLRRKPTAQPAAAAGAPAEVAKRQQEQEDGQERREEDTSLWLRQQHGGGGAAGGAAAAAGGLGAGIPGMGGQGLNPVLWAQMLWAMEAGEHEGDDDDWDIPPPLFSDSDAEVEGSEDMDEGSSDEEWRPAQSDSSEESEIQDLLSGSPSSDTEHEAEELPAAARDPASPAAAAGAAAAAQQAQDHPHAAAAAQAAAAAAQAAQQRCEQRQQEAGGDAATAEAAPAGLVLAEEEDFDSVEYEWWYPPIRGEAPGARGYHSAAVSEDGCKVYFFGGIGPSGASGALAVLDVRTWEFSRPATSGTPPAPRCGHSSCVYGGRLWVVGGGSGHDLLRSGRDFADVHCLDLETLEWSRLDLRQGPTCAGKCHAAVLVGSRLLLFGGSMRTCAELAWLDLESRRWGEPARVLGEPPMERLSATAVLAGEEVLVYGGYTFHAREMGDVQRLKLITSEEDDAPRNREASGSRAGPSRQRQRLRFI